MDNDSKPKHIKDILPEVEAQLSVDESPIADVTVALEAAKRILGEAREGGDRQRIDAAKDAEVLARADLIEENASPPHQNDI